MYLNFLVLGFSAYIKVNLGVVTGLLKGLERFFCLFV